MGIIVFLLGIIIGGIVSWAISHEYHNKSVDKERIVDTCDTIVDKPINQVWKLISNPENFYKFYHRDAKKFEDINIGRGTIIRTLGLYGQSKEYIVIWEPENVLAWGEDPYTWINYIELKPQGDKTAIFLRRRARTITDKWWEIILYKLRIVKPLNLSSGHYLTLKMLQKIERLCETN